MKLQLLLLSLILNVGCSIISYHRNLLNEKSEKCLDKFFMAVINEKYECSKGYDFLEKDLMKRRVAYTDGKSCFLEIMKEECPDDEMEENFTNFLQMITDKPMVTGACSAPFFKLESLICEAEKHALQLEMQEQHGEKENHDGAVKVLKMCRDAQRCMKDSCKYTNFEREEIENSCDVLELTTSEFTVCMDKINREKPDLSKYDCLKGHEFYSKDAAAICDRWQKRKDCMRTVTSDICGKDVMKDDEKFLNVFIKNLKCDV